jgi:hypothetical protein
MHQGLQSFNSVGLEDSVGGWKDRDDLFPYIDDGRLTRNSKDEVKQATWVATSRLPRSLGFKTHLEREDGGPGDRGPGLWVHCGGYQ